MPAADPWKGEAMNRTWFGRVTLGIIGLIVLGGCNPISLTSMLIYGTKGSEVPPEYPLPVPEGKEKTGIKIVPLVTTPQLHSSEFVGVDRDLASLFERELNYWFKAADEKVEVVSQLDLEKYRRVQRSTINPIEIGKNFEADYVIDVELTGLRMYEPGAYNHLFKGQATVSVVVHDVANGGEAIPQFEYVSQYPRVGPMVKSFDTPASEFRTNFLKSIAQELAWKFAPHLREDEKMPSSRFQ